MTDLAVRTTRLTKRFGHVLAVDGVDLRVHRGEVFGFLGLNGAGKSTTIRLLLGMVRPTAGHAEILGVRVGGARGPWGKVGHLVETPSAWPELSVRENLQAAGALQGVRDGRAIDRTIERLGLGEHAHRRAGTLSTGNLQRLALARALLHGPELLVLDEPANGLDPAGVVEVRELLRDLARARGTTVFISSHILAEVDRLATRIGIIHRGRLLEELDASELERHPRRRLEIGSRDLDRAEAALRQGGFQPDRTPAKGEDARLELTEGRALERPDEISRLLVEAGASPTHLVVVQEDLERRFLRITRNSGGK
jgi:ABC-2 type transport system ATP-binding protein